MNDQNVFKFVANIAKKGSIYNCLSFLDVFLRAQTGKKTTSS
jgi:hypothetical protein